MLLYLTHFVSLIWTADKGAVSWCQRDLPGWVLFRWNIHPHPADRRIQLHLRQLHQNRVHKEGQWKVPYNPVLIITTQNTSSGSDCHVLKSCSRTLWQEARSLNAKTSLIIVKSTNTVKVKVGWPYVPLFGTKICLRPGILNLRKCPVLGFCYTRHLLYHFYLVARHY